MLLAELGHISPYIYELQISYLYTQKQSLAIVSCQFCAKGQKGLILLCRSYFCGGKGLAWPLYNDAQYISSSLSHRDEHNVAHEDREEQNITLSKRNCNAKP